MGIAGPGGLPLRDPAPTYHFVFVVEDCGLAGCDRALRFVKCGMNAFAIVEGCSRNGSSVAQAGSWRWRILILTRMGPVNSRNADPVETRVARSVAGGQLVIRAHGHAMAAGSIWST